MRYGSLRFFVAALLVVTPALAAGHLGYTRTEASVHRNIAMLEYVVGQAAPSETDTFAVTASGVLAEREVGERLVASTRAEAGTEMWTMAYLYGLGGAFVGLLAAFFLVHPITHGLTYWARRSRRRQFSALFGLPISKS